MNKERMVSLEMELMNDDAQLLEFREMTASFILGQRAISAVAKQACIDRGNLFWQWRA